MCLFCKIIDGEIPNNTVLENDEFLCFHDINPAAKIHVLIIPKKHYDSFDVIPAQLMANMTEFIHKVADKLGVREDGYRLITNIKDHGGQEVHHLHMHLLAGEYVGRLVGAKK
ncbi:histidine triad nucleotide-binding protein [Malaciobacter halophilus]|uniref:Histidine triad nucleotide-binding protein n=1 Tax=Malaciobacter halophilus TaxID=197482 RepID=A0A2N1J3Y2_9BACT|nr:histidine triad nucleotide-binding protein [Malaciobacter halophilus]AXH08727.1 histidine triad nucleotide-binding protein, Hint/PKCI branch [Malaciobacter halophilus]PKI81253.1 histidine triad nucleotide-binding protein [Malaciobacter halophilus]